MLKIGPYDIPRIHVYTNSINLRRAMADQPWTGWVKHALVDNDMPADAIYHVDVLVTSISREVDGKFYFVPLLIIQGE